jgi:hypothetical protein
MTFKYINSVVALASTSLFYPSFKLEEILRQKVMNGSMNYNFIVGSLNDFTFPYLATTAILCYIESFNVKIKDKYKMIISSILPTIFTINEFYPFLPGRHGVPANNFDKNDIIAFALAGIGAYLTSKIINSNFSFRKKKDLESKIYDYII